MFPRNLTVVGCGVGSAVRCSAARRADLAPWEWAAPGQRVGVGQPAPHAVGRGRARGPGAAHPPLGDMALWEIRAAFVGAN